MINEGNDRRNDRTRNNLETSQDYRWSNDKKWTGPTTSEAELEKLTEEGGACLKYL